METEAMLEVMMRTNMILEKNECTEEEVGYVGKLMEGEVGWLGGWVVGWLGGWVVEW